MNLHVGQTSAFVSWPVPSINSSRMVKKLIRPSGIRKFECFLVKNVV